MISITEASVGEKEYLVYLSLERTDRFRYYHNLERGKITRFRVQYEALIGGEWRAIVRYDTAHGRTKTCSTQTAPKTSTSSTATLVKKC